ncbi:hypothetical protein QFC19_008467 [Naganishia cerealis]|uniref:Uncharacterized protein n=1 Tax=Naganishia cerealis TaxID=610337 RepID=A0ACC2V1Q6_9TREE|nr:hypothetical protein QFC19_008467 [Naganishia cerealis]
MALLPEPSDQHTTIVHLAHLATEFRDPTIRSSYVEANPNFAGWLDQVIKRTLALLTDNKDISALGSQDRQELIESLRVIANLVADNAYLYGLYARRQQKLATGNSSVDLDLAKPLLGAILNLVLTSSYTSAQDYWIEDAQWVNFMILGNALYNPGEESVPLKTEHKEDWAASRALRAVLSSWAWKIVSSVSETEAFTKSDVLSAVPPRTLVHLTAPLEHFSRNVSSVENNEQPEQQQSDPSSTMSDDLEILGSCSTLVHLLSTTAVGSKLISDAMYVAGQRVHDQVEIGRAAERMLGFVEFADVVDTWEDEDEDEDEDGEEQDGMEQRHNVSTGTAANPTHQANSASPKSTLRPGEKQLGAAKSSIMAALAEVCAGFEFFDHERDEGLWLWQTITRWIGVGATEEESVEDGAREARDDLISCGLLCIGNYIRSDSTANTIASQGAVVSHLIHLLNTATPQTPVQITHSLIGLLRNLALAPQLELRGKLIIPVVNACLRIGVFQRQSDLLGSVQVTPSSSLTLDATSTTLSAKSELLDQILELQLRVDDQAIKIEISRLMTTLLTALAKAGDLASRDSRPMGHLADLIQDMRVLACPATLIELGAQHETLLAEGVLAMALVAKSDVGGKSLLQHVAEHI